MSPAEADEPGYSGLLDRGLAVLELLCGAADGLSLTAVSERLRIPRSATHRLFAALAAHGYVRQEQDRGLYVLTSKLQRLAFAHLSASGFVDAAQPVLDRLAAQTGELARLAVADGGELVWVARAQGARSGLRYDPDMGTGARLSCSATGHAWLSRLGDDEALALVEKQGWGGREAYGPQAPQTAAELLAFLEAARPRGYAVAVRTFADWMSAMAAVLPHPANGTPIGVVSLAGPVSRLPEGRLHELAPLLTAAAAEIGALRSGSPALTSPALAVRAARAGLPPRSEAR